MGGPGSTRRGEEAMYDVIVTGLSAAQTWRSSVCPVVSSGGCFQSPVLPLGSKLHEPGEIYVEYIYFANM